MTAHVTTIYLPRRALMLKTNAHDPVDYYYRPLIGPAYRQRLALAIDALGGRRYDRLLEIGYGSGILLPELARHCADLHGIDLHDQLAPVRHMLSVERVQADLKTGSVTDLEYPDSYFDAVVCLSVLEHLEPVTLARALSEIKRVCRPGGVAVIGYPIRNLITDAFFRLLGFKPRELHPSGHHDIRTQIDTRFATAVTRVWPAGLSMNLALYALDRCEA